MGLASKIAETVGGWFGESDERTNAGRDAEPEPREEPKASLFQCPDCDSVYVATDKDACSTCETSVDEIPSVLAETE